jgi:PPP family 3-phenylpropionic acid transporter
MLMRIFAIPALTGVADRHDALRGALIATSVAATLGYALLGFMDGLLAIAVFYALVSLAFTPTMPLADAFALKGLARIGGAYGRVRLWGSGAFLVGSFLAGVAIDLIPARDLIWLVVAAMALSASAAVMLTPMPPDPAPAASAPPGAQGLLRNRLFLVGIGTASLTNASHALYYGFSTLDWTAAGIDGTAIGVLWAIGVLAEIVLFALAGRLPVWIGPIELLLIGAGGAVLRWTAMAFDPPVAMLPVLQVLHAASFGANHLGAIMLISKIAPHGQAATAQGYFSIALGLTMAVTTSLSGWLFARYGDLAYAAMALSGLAGGAGALLAYRLRNPGAATGI